MTLCSASRTARCLCHKPRRPVQVLASRVVFRQTRICLRRTEVGRVSRQRRFDGARPLRGIPGELLERFSVSMTRVISASCQDAISLLRISHYGILQVRLREHCFMNHKVTNTSRRVLCSLSSQSAFRSTSPRTPFRLRPPEEEPFTGLQLTPLESLRYSRNFSTHLCSIAGRRSILQPRCRPLNHRFFD